MDAESRILADAITLFRRVYKRCRAIAHAEFVGEFGQAWRGGHFQWPFLLPGHGYELTQHGTYTFTSGEVPPGADVSSVHPIIYSTDAITDYATGQVPDVQATPQTSGWIAYAKPTSGAEETSLDLWVERNAAGASARQTGYHAATVWNGYSVSGLTSGTPGTAETVTYPTAFDSTPSLMAHVETVSGGVPTGIWAADYIPVIQSQSASGFTFLLDYRPAQGTPADTDYAPTGLSDTTTTMLGILGAPVKAEATTDAVPGAGETGAIEAGISTGAQDHNHTHSVPSGTDASGGTTGNQSVDHAHGMSPPGSTHKHPVGPHTHLIDDHHHAVVEPHSGDGHRHALLPATVSGDQTRAVVWTAIGPEATSAGLPTVSWQATAVQAA
jgi:hypothetical protein